MADWILVPSLAQLRAEFNEIAPGRDRASDGSVGDQAHADRVSSHNPDETGAVPIRDADRTNEVHAIDVDVDLRTPGLTMEMVVQHLVARSRAGLEDRLRNIIYNRRIWAASSGWKQQVYTGENAHTQHGHFEASYATAAEADTHSWHLEDLVALTEAETRKVVREELTAWGKVDPIATLTNRTGYLANQFAPSVAKAVAEIVPEDIDEDELAAAIVAKLPTDADDITPEELQAAIVGAARELIAAQPAP